MNALGGKHVRLDQLIERQQRGRAGADVIRHGGERNLGRDLRLLHAALEQYRDCITSATASCRRKARPTLTQP
jgi:hypothetical protein